MAIYTCLDSAGDRLDRFYQYDANRVIRITGITNEQNEEVLFHFSSKNTELAFVVYPDSFENYHQAVVPNELLARHDVITIYIVIKKTNEDVSKTIHRISIPVEPRPQPPEYATSADGIADGMAVVGEYITLTSNGVPIGEPAVI